MVWQSLMETDSEEGLPDWLWEWGKDGSKYSTMSGFYEGMSGGNDGSRTWPQEWALT